MSTVLATATQTGRYEYDQSSVKDQVKVWLNGSGRRLERVVRAFDHDQVQTRTSVEPIDYIFSKRSFEESNNCYIKHAVELATQVTTQCLENAGLKPTDIDYVISTSCTGIMIPSVDAVVAERLGMKSSLRRLPITEHGCAAGAVALAQAHDYLIAHPEATVLIIAVEIPSLTFQPNDKTPTNVISTALFGDGAAAVILRSTPQAGQPRILQTKSHRFPNSLDWMGFELKNTGLQIVLSREVPDRVREASRAVIEEFLTECDISLEEIDHFLLHPGGGKIIQAFEETLELGPDDLDLSRSVLRRFGNLSSATVLFILHEAIQRRVSRSGDRGLMMAFGPGFGAELLLMDWAA